MDYSPWLKGKIWSNFKVAISPKPERAHPPKLVGMHYTSTPTCTNFLSRFKSIQFFHYHGYSPWSKRKIWSNFKVAISPKPERPHPPKLVYMYYTSTPTCKNFFDPILSDSIFSLPWTIIHGQKGKNGQILK